MLSKRISYVNYPILISKSDAQLGGGERREGGRGKGGERGGRGEVGRSPLLFFENQKKCPDFRKKDCDCVHPYVKFNI